MQAPKQIDHLGIAVPSIDDAAVLYRDVFGLTSAGTEVIEDQGVRVMFFTLGQIRIELLEPTTDDSPIARFLARRGPGLHHVAYSVEDLPATLAALKAAGTKLIDDSPRDGAHGMKIAFAHPKSTHGVLTEFCQPAQ
jgi:methylmalonyl-CoA/ethylmalonyl-CoA epimerase